MVANGHQYSTKIVNDNQRILKVVRNDFNQRQLKKTQIFHCHLVGGFNPLKNISQNGNLPQIEVKIKNI